MYDNLLYYCVVISLLIPFNEEAEGSVLLGLLFVMLLTTLVWNLTPLTLYVSVCIGEVLNILLYMRLEGRKRWLLICAAMYSIFLNLFVWVDAWQNVFYIHYTFMNTLLVEATLIILTFSTFTLINKKAP